MRMMAVLAVLMTAGWVGMDRSVAAQSAIEDLRSARVRTNQQGSGFKPPLTKEEWLARRQKLRDRILVSTGLYPMPQKTPLSPRVYGKVERDGYTIEKVVLETLPGFFLSGNLYRPSAPVAPGTKIPGILNPHGHWPEGRVAADVQARCAGQARIGAVAFLYDMVGYHDSKAFGHQGVFADDAARAYGMNLNGLQLWNSIRALDYLTSLPEVDAKRIACTGESGGGTQTFELCAVDDRIAVAAPVCMVSHHFQGGCLCENAPHKRVGTDNVEFAALFAPKPQLLVGATGDWTSQILQHGVPEIRATYRLFNAEHNLLAVIHEAPHNYNQASRESVYAFLKQHLWGEPSPTPVKEAAFKAEEAAALSTWDSEHPRPADALDPEKLKANLREVFLHQIASWKPASKGQWQDSKKTVRTGLEQILACELPRKDQLQVEQKEPVLNDRFRYRSTELTLARRGHGDAATGLLLTPVTLQPTKKPAVITVVVHPGGPKAILGSDGSPNQLVEGLLEAHQGVLLLETFLTGKPEEVAKRHASNYYATYNATVLAERVQDVLNAVAAARELGKSVNLVGLEKAGPWVVLARPFAGNVERTAADAAGWEWSTDLPMSHEMTLPAALRYGGMKAFAALCSPEPLFLYNSMTGLDVSWVQGAYNLEAPKKLRLSSAPAPPETVLSWLVSRGK